MEERTQNDWMRVGGLPCLDFVNTVGGRVSPRGRTGARGDFADRVTRDDLPDYESLLRWSTFASLLDASQTSRLRGRARRSAAAAGRALRLTLELREAVYRIGKALIESWPPPARDLRILDQVMREARQHQRLVARRGRLETEWTAEAGGLHRMLWPIALSAAELFGSLDVKQLKQCPGTECGWLFLDTTRNHSRQWCDMADCGNLAKVRRFRRARAASALTPGARARRYSPRRSRYESFTKSVRPVRTSPGSRARVRGSKPSCCGSSS